MTKIETWVDRVRDGDEHAEIVIDTSWGKRDLAQDAINQLKKGALSFLKCAGIHVEASELMSQRRYHAPPALRMGRLDDYETELLFEEAVFLNKMGVGYGHCSPVVITTYPQNLRGACLSGLAYARMMEGKAPVILAVLDRTGAQKPKFLAWEKEAIRLNVPTTQGDRWTLYADPLDQPIRSII